LLHSVHLRFTRPVSQQDTEQRQHSVSQMTNGKGRDLVSQQNVILIRIQANSNKKLCYRKEDSVSVVLRWFSSLTALFSATYGLDIPDFRNWCLSHAYRSSIGHISAFWQGTSHSFIRLDTIPACDGKTDIQTDGHTSPWHLHHWHSLQLCRWA